MQNRSPANRTTVVAVVAAVLLAGLLAVSFIFRLPCVEAGSASDGSQPGATNPAQEGAAGSYRGDADGRGPDARGAVGGPSPAETRAAIDRAVGWLRATRIHPTAGGLDDFRAYALEIRAWQLLSLYATDRGDREAYREELVERLSALGDGAALVALYDGASIPKYIAELLVVLAAARDAGYALPAIETRLASLVQAGLQAPARPVPLQIALRDLITSVGLDLGPTIEQLRPRGMLRTQPREAQMGLMEAYLLTHEIFGLSGYGTDALELAPSEREWLEPVLRFWTLFYRVTGRTDIGAELAVSDQVAGLAGSYEYGEMMRLIVESQAPEGHFVEPAQPEPEVPLRPADRLHLVKVALQALLGHEALSTGRGLPG